MTAAAAELMIVPEVSRTAVKEMQRDMNKGLKKVGDDAERQIAKGVKDGVKKGAKESRGAFRNLAGNIGGGIRKGYDSIGGARGLAGGVLGLGLVGLIDSIDKADQGNEMILAMLQENTSRQQIATAKGAGFELDEFAAFSRTLQSAGFREQQDINDVIFDIQERARDAETGGNPVLAQFKDLDGRELVNTVLASISQLEGKDQAFALAELGFGGETGQNLQRVLQVASENGALNADDTKTALDESQMSEGQRLAEFLTKQADLTQTFQDKQLEKTLDFQEKLLNEINGDSIKTFFEAQDQTQKQQVEILANYEDNQANAVDARNAINTTMNTLNDTTNALIGAIRGLADKLGITPTLSAEEIQANSEVKAAQNKIVIASKDRLNIGGGGLY